MAASLEFPDAVCFWWIYSCYWNILVVICGILCSFLTLVCVTTVPYRIFLRAYRDMYRSLCIAGIPVCRCIVSALIAIFHKYCGYTNRGGITTNLTLQNQKHIAALVLCYNAVLVRDKLLGVPASVKLVYTISIHPFVLGWPWSKYKLGLP